VAPAAWRAWGGEEFLPVLPNTSPDQAVRRVGVQGWMKGVMRAISHEAGRKTGPGLHVVLRPAGWTLLDNGGSLQADALAVRVEGLLTPVGALGGQPCKVNTMFKKILLAACIASATLGAQAAGTNLLQNASFEAAGPDFSKGYDGTYCYLAYAPLACGSLPDWTGSPVALLSASGVWGTPKGLTGWSKSFGDQLAGIQGTSVLEQDLVLAAGTYTLSWFDANRVGYGGNQNYDVIVGGDKLGNFSTVAGQGWAEHSLTFTTAGGSQAIQFAGMVGADATTFIDQTSLTAVPEPTSLALMMVGTLGLLARRRRIGR
jgi:hypothetical protein